MALSPPYRGPCQATPVNARRIPADPSRPERAGLPPLVVKRSLDGAALQARECARPSRSNPLEHVIAAQQTNSQAVAKLVRLDAPETNRVWRRAPAHSVLSRRNEFVDPGTGEDVRKIAHRAVRPIPPAQSKQGCSLLRGHA